LRLLCDIIIIVIVIVIIVIVIIVIVVVIIIIIVIVIVIKQFPASFPSQILNRSDLNVTISNVLPLC